MYSRSLFAMVCLERKEIQMKDREDQSRGCSASSLSRSSYDDEE